MARPIESQQALHRSADEWLGAGLPAGRAGSAPQADELLGDRFFRHLVFNLRTGVLAITRDGRIAAMNDLAYRVLGLPPRTRRHRPAFTEVLQDCPEVCARPAAGVRERRPAQPRRDAAAQDGPRDRLHALAHPRRPRGARRRDAVLQGPDARRADRRTRAPARSAGGARRDGGGDRARGQESARQHRGHGRRAQAPADRAARSARDAQRHHQGSQDGQRHRGGSARVRAADSSCRSSARALDEVLKDSITLAEGKMRRGAVSINTRHRAGRARAARRLGTSCGSCSRTCSRTPSRRSAAKATSTSGRTLRAGRRSPSATGEPAAPQVVVEVRDNGPGIGADDLERIFSPFFTTKPQGTGLGLAIVRKVVDAHDGHIDAVSAPGRGATFRVTLPVVPSVGSMGR